MAALAVTGKSGSYRRLIGPLIVASSGFGLFGLAPHMVEQLGFPAGDLAVRAANYAFGIIAWLALAWLGARALDLILARAAVGPQVRIPRLLRDMGRVVLFGMAVVAIVNFVLGRSATGLLAASGVLVAVVGFALRNLIADIFSGLALSLEHPYRIGDWIEAGSGVVGQVVEIDWRATRLVTRDNVSVVIPNGLIAAGKLLNYSYGDGRYRARLDVMLDASIPVDRAKRVLLTGAIATPGVLSEPPPQVQVQECTDRGVTYIVRYWVSDFVNDQHCRDAVASNVLQSLHQSGLALAYPKRDVIVARQRPVATQLRPSRPALLERTELFACLTSQERAELAELMAERTYAAGTPVVRQGDPGASLFILAEGVLDVHVAADGSKPTRLDRMLPGDVFGEISLLTGKPRSASVTSATDAVVYEIDKQDLEPILRRRPELAQDLAAVMQRHQSHNQERLQALSTTESLEAPADPVPNLMRRICSFFGLSE
jgi:small-conductance mechanosensitive channel/CRP-like cAMP-binding protein